MKILHYINNLTSGGAEKLLTDILPLMKEKGCDVEILIINNYKNVPKYDLILKKSKINVTSFQTSFYNPFQVFKLIKFLRKGNFDIVHAHLFPSQYWLAIASFFVPSSSILIKTEHSVHNERKNYSFLRALEIFIYSKYSNIIAITDQVKDNLDEWLQRKVKIDVIHNGVNIHQIIKETIQQSSLFSKENFNLLMVGRFDGSQKDQDSLIKSLTMLPKHIHLFLAGEGPHMSKSKKLVINLNLKDRVHFLGMRQDIYSLMKQVDLNILSTNHEGLSGVTLESLASGVPFVGSNVVGVNDVVPDDTFLFPKSNPKMLAAKIEEVLLNKTLQESMIKKALSHVKKYDISFMVEKHLDLYRKNLRNE